VRVAFSLIELVFSIVIIGISVVSLPLMSIVSADADAKNMNQKLIFRASSELNQAVMANWDENSIDSGDINSLAKVIDDGSCESDKKSVRYMKKIGHINQPFHRSCSPKEAVSTQNISVDSLEDMQKLLYIGDNLEYSLEVIRVLSPKFDGVNNPNMKSIRVEIRERKSEELITSFASYSANIGEVDYYKRRYR